MPKYYTLEEVEKHNKKESAWIILNNKVYDITNFSEHPGTLNLLIEKSGQDLTETFKIVKHSKDALEWTKKFYIGDLVKENCIIS